MAFRKGCTVPALLRKSGAPPMVWATTWTDNCSEQFKCKYHWGWVADAGICVLDAHGVSTGRKLHIDQNYFGPKHGNNPSDGAGASVKNFATTMVKNQGWAYVKSSKDLCTKLEKGMGFVLLEATSEERTAFFAEKEGTRPGGTEQLVMTKVRTDGSIASVVMLTTLTRWATFRSGFDFGRDGYLVHVCAGVGTHYFDFTVQSSYEQAVL